MLTKFSILASAIIILAGTIVGTFSIQTVHAEEESKAGGIFITGHDPDYHSVEGNTTGPRHLVQAAIEFVTYENPDPKILLVTDVENPGDKYSDPRKGLIKANFTDFDVADHGSGIEGIFDLNTVDFNNYDVIVVASDYGGWLKQREVDILVNRSDDLIDFINNGGGIVAFSESGQRPIITEQPVNVTEAEQPVGVARDRFGFIPFNVGQVSLTQSEKGVTLSGFGKEMGLLESDVNTNVAHSYFTSNDGMNIVDVDEQGRVLTLAIRGQTLSIDQETSRPACP